MSETIKADSYKTTFDFGDGVTFTVDTFRLERLWNKVYDEAKAANDTHYQYLDRLAAFVKQTYSVDLTEGQVEFLNNHLVPHNTEKKRVWLAPLNALAGSPASTASTASPPED